MCHSAKIMSEIFFIAVILPVSVIFVIIRHIARASRWKPIVLTSVMHSSSCVIIRDRQAKIAHTQTLGKHVEWHIFTFLIFAKRDLLING